MATETRQIDDTIEVVTPENTAFEYRAAGPFRRFLAYVVDYVLRAFIVLAVSIIAMMTLAGIIGDAIMLVILITFFIVNWFYGGLFETFMNGQTPGKRLLGIRVLSTDGHPINGMQAILRNVLRYVDEAPYLSLMAFPVFDDMFGQPWTYQVGAVYWIPTYLIGLVVMAANRRFQRLGDLVCGTMVIVEERQWLTGTIKLEDPRAAQLAEYIPANFVVTRTMARAIAAYADRRRFFSPARRREVARHLAEPLLVEFQLPADTSYDLLLCALYHRTFVLQASDPGSAARIEAKLVEPPAAALATSR
jgi:uncharacterized RDD family membrane protein YckC